MNRLTAWRVGFGFLTICIPTIASTQQVAEIVVTAQKREQSADSVGMSITAIPGDTLRDRGITDVTQLGQAVPGFTAQQSAFNSTSFTLRGVGLFNSDLSSPPAVTVYLDEAPLPYPALSSLASFDVERVEVLKGPQGTLYGQNATGGAVNYVAAKPSDRLQLGLGASYGRFNRVQADGFVSGPMGDHMNARFAVQAERGDGWQESITRPADRLGRIKTLRGRGTLDWHPQAHFKSRLTLGISYDGSDSLAGQFVAPVATVPTLAVPGLLTFPVVTTPRAADWTRVRLDTGSAFPYGSDITHFQVILRNEYEVSSALNLTALTAYSHSHVTYGQDPDGTPFHISEIVDDAGRISSAFQELRVSARHGPIRGLLGANYEHDEVKDATFNFVQDNDVCHLFQSVNPRAYCDYSLYTGRTHVNTSGVFGQIEDDIDAHLNLQAGVRHNSDRRSFDNCGTTLTQHLADYWNYFRGPRQTPFLVGHCFVADPANQFAPVDNVHKVLDESAVSWKLGANWNPKPELLLYANLSKGYKAGSVPVLAATTVAQFTPVPQESVLAYEAGIKASLLGHRLQLNTAAFYYDYRDKQLRGSLLDPVSGPLEALVSIPRSHVQGLEAQLRFVPLAGLALESAVTYVRTQIDEFTGFNALAQFGNQAGTPFPFSPKWQSTTHIDYEIPLHDGARGFLGSSLVYNSKTYAGVGAAEIQRIDAFALLDLRAGMDFAGGRYRIWAWGKNITNKYYWTNVLPYGNAISRYVGQPATFGFSVALRIQGR